MGKGKSTVSSNNKRQPSKTFDHTDEKHTKSKTKKNLVNKKEAASEFDADSLKSLKCLFERKISNGVDEKIELLKRELKMLFNDKMQDKNVISCNQIEPEGLGSNPVKPAENDLKSIEINKKNFEPIRGSSSSKFSVLPIGVGNKKIILDTSKENLTDENNLQIILESQIDMTGKSELLANKPKFNNFNIPSFSEEKVEEMLYKSFVMQNSELKPSVLEESSSSLSKSTIKKKKEKFSRYKKLPPKDYNNKKLLTQHKFGKFSRFSKRRKRIDRSSITGDVEIINLESSSCSNEMSKNDSVSTDLGMKDYDWNEPFDLDDTELTDIEIIEKCEDKHTFKSQKQKSNGTDFKDPDIKSCNNEETQLIRAWECPVCFEQFIGQEVVATQCGHVFCKNCLEYHFSKLSKSCPSCRSSLSSQKPFITLFNF